MMNHQNDALLRFLRGEGQAGGCGSAASDGKCAMPMGHPPVTGRAESCTLQKGHPAMPAPARECGCGTPTYPSLAMVYAPEQCFDDLYECSEAICHGTLFKALDKPFCGAGRGK